MDWNVYDLLSALGWALLAAGWIARRNRTAHLRLVIPGMALDLGLVLWLEFTRSVIAQTVTTSYSPLQWTHIGASAAATVLYLPVIWLGIALVRRKATPAQRSWHRRLAVAALLLRTVGLAFQWTV
ncbi:MAG: hypothetical protein HMLKMBBP_00659 [Planctomycetes bacterium]|nr:hypothetical protein [Planctomycetota bacterium]